MDTHTDTDPDLYAPRAFKIGGSKSRMLDNLPVGRSLARRRKLAVLYTQAAPTADETVMSVTCMSASNKQVRWKGGELTSES
jgi:hypothetical protein